MKAMVAVLSGTILLAGCTKKSDDGGANAPIRTQLSLTDLNPPKRLATLSESDLKTKIGKTSEFSQLFTGVKASASLSLNDSAVSSCLADRMGKLRMGGKNNTLTVSGRLDLASCYADNSDVKITVAMVEYHVMRRCQSSDFTQFDGKTLADAPASLSWFDDSLCPNGDPIEASQLVRLDLRAVNNSSEGAVVVNFNAVSGLGDPATGEPCKFSRSDRTTTMASCTFVKTDSISGTVNGKPYEDGKLEDELILIRYSDVAFTPGARYPERGSLSFQINNWNGKVTYTSATAAPTWQASNASGQNISGNLTALATTPGTAAPTPTPSAGTSPLSSILSGAQIGQLGKVSNALRGNH